MFSQASVHNWPHGYWFTARLCYGVVGTHPTGMVSCVTLYLPFEDFDRFPWKPLLSLSQCVNDYMYNPLLSDTCVQ